MGRTQMNFIHLLSIEAMQHITIHCLNTSVWAAGPSLQPSTRAVSFKAWTGEMIRAGDLLEPLIPRDDCWVWTLTSLACISERVHCERLFHWLNTKMNMRTPSKWSQKTPLAFIKWSPLIYNNWECWVLELFSRFCLCTDYTEINCALMHRPAVFPTYSIYSKLSSFFLLLPFVIWPDRFLIFHLSSVCNMFF